MSHLGIANLQIPGFSQLHIHVRITHTCVQFSWLVNVKRMALSDTVIAQIYFRNNRDICILNKSQVLITDCVFFLRRQPFRGNTELKMPYVYNRYLSKSRKNLHRNYLPYHSSAWRFYRLITLYESNSFSSRTQPFYRQRVVKRIITWKKSLCATSLHR